MDLRSYEKAVLASYIWRCGRSQDLNEMLAIGCALRNRVTKFGSYADMFGTVESFQACPLRDYPSIKDEAFCDQNIGVLSFVDRLYDGSERDITATHDHEGALLFAHAPSIEIGSDFQKMISSEEYVLLGTFGTQSFWGRNTNFGHIPVNPMARFTNDVRTFASRTL